MRALLLLSLALSVGCFVKPTDTGEPDADNDGYVRSEDCDETDPDINPGAAERCNGVDDDCDGEIDEEGAEGSDLFYADVDGDGYGDENNTIEICDLPDGYVAAPYDCDDSRADVNPTGTEVCDEVDNDCDGNIDEDADDAPTWYADADEDGYGDEDATVEACDQPDGYVANAEDCDDRDDARSPDADELCDGTDNNCDGHIDEDSALDAEIWYADADHDGFGAAASTTTACDQPTGYTDNDEDCDDSDDEVNPYAEEVCNETDDDCDGAIDEDAIDASIWYADADGDNYGDPTTAVAACEVPTDHVVNDDDCDDGDASINPRATEICDGIDNDCSGVVDATGLVTLDGTTNYASVGQAVRNARAGGSVVVCSGTYTENIEITVDLELRSQNGSGATTLDGDGGSPVITVTAGSVDISGFTLIDGAGDLHPENPAVTAGGGIQLMSTDPAVLSDLVFRNNDADYGAGLFGNEGCNVALSDITFDLNNAEYSGGAGYLWDCTATMDEVGLEDNYATYGGGFYLQGGDITLTSVVAIDNYAAEWGGAFYLTDSAQVGASDDTLITGNTAVDWGGGLMLDTGAVWAGGELYDNDSDFGGGFFSYTDGSADNEIEDLLCEANQADTSGGCGYVIGDLTITTSQLLDNYGLWAGGLMLDDSTTYIFNSTLEENVAAYNGGGVYMLNDAILWSVSSDWGTASADNDPDDVFVDSGSNAYALFGTGETFSCSDTLGTCS